MDEPRERRHDNDRRERDRSENRGDYSEDRAWPDAVHGRLGQSRDEGEGDSGNLRQDRDADARGGGDGDNQQQIGYAGRSQSNYRAALSSKAADRSGDAEDIDPEQREEDRVHKALGLTHFSMPHCAFIHTTYVCFCLSVVYLFRWFVCLFACVYIYLYTDCIQSIRLCYVVEYMDAFLHFHARI